MTETPKLLTKAVYIRRRIAVFFGVIALIAVVVGLIAGPHRVMSWFGVSTGSSEGERGQDNGGSDGTPQPEAPAEPAACDTERLGVAAVSDQTSYGAGENPKLSLRVTNHNEVTCDVDLGTATMAFVLTSGSEKYWDSRDCQTDGEEFLVRMEPGQTLETQPLEWDRTRSTPDTCDDDRPVAPGGGASYHLTAEIAGVQSATTQQFLLY